VKDVHGLDSLEVLQVTSEISTIAATSSGLLVADTHGSIHVLDKDFEPVRSWVAHVGGRVTHMIERKGVLVTLGEEDNVRSPLLKIWELEKIDKKTNSPNLLRSVKTQQSNRPHPVSTQAFPALVTLIYSRSLP
jgi:vacuolar protein sorting-associated protein 11